MLDSSELEDSARPLEKEKDVYKKIKLLGQGAYGKAYLVECCQDKSKWVIKQVNMSDMSPEEKEVTAREVKILEKLDHPNIVRFREIYRTNKDKLSFVMEYADGGDLATRITEQKKIGRLFTEIEVLNLFTQICLAVKHVHDRKVIHRDIKGQNIFLHQDNIVKLGDFGIARQLHRTIEKAKTVVGTPYYLSPEIIQNKPYSFKSDIWSLGVLLYEMCALQPPFNGNSLQFLALKIVKGVYTAVPPSFSKGLQALIRSMLSVDPNKRPTIHQILDSRLLIDRITNFLSQSKRQDEFSHTILHNQNLMEPRRPKLPMPKTQNKAESIFELGAPPNLLKIGQGKLSPPASNHELKEPERSAEPIVQHVHQIQIQQHARPQKTPPVQHKTPINGFYRPPSSHQIKPTKNDQVDLADLLNIKARPLSNVVSNADAHVPKTPLPKIKTPDVVKKRPSTPNLNAALVPKPAVMNHRPSVELVGDFKKKPRYSVEEPKDVKRNCSEERMPLNGNNKHKEFLKVPNAACHVDIAEPKKSPKPDGGGHAPTPKQERKEASKPQTAASNQKKRVELKPLPKKQPVVQKKQTKEAPSKTKKEPIKKVAAKKKEKPLEIKSEEVKKQEKEEIERKKQTRQEQHRKMKEDIKQKRRLLSETNRKQLEEGRQEQFEERCEEQKVNEIESQLPESISVEKQHVKVGSQPTALPIEENIDYDNEEFEHYIEECQVEKISQQHPKERVVEQYSSAPLLEPREQKIEVKHSVEFRKMLEEMQRIVDHTTERVDQLQDLPQIREPKLTAPPEMTQFRMELTIRQEDLESISQSRVELEYSLTQGELGLEYIGDHSKLEDLRIILEEVFGVDTFVAVYRRIEKLIEERGLDFDESKVMRDITAQIAPIDEKALSKYFSLLVTLVSLEGNLLE